MVIISNMDTPNIIYDIYHLNQPCHVNKWKSQPSINYHVNYGAPLAPTAGAIPYFYIFFRYLKTVALIIVNKTENR